MPNVDWTRFLIGLALGIWGIPMILGLLNSRRRASAQAAS